MAINMSNGHMEIPTNWDLHETLRSVAEKLERVDQRLASLDQRLAATEPDPLPEECRSRRCSFYQHYIAQGPSYLSHDGFHAAEARCKEAQQRCIAYHQLHGYEGDEKDPCCKEAARWERLVRA